MWPPLTGWPFPTPIYFTECFTRGVPFIRDSPFFLKLLNNKHRNMIEHCIYYYNDGFSCEWEKVKLPFRLNKGDEVHNELLDNKGVMRKRNTKKETKEQVEKWISFCAKTDSEYFLVKNISINHIGIIEVWLTQSVK